MGDQKFRESLAEFKTNSTEAPGYERAYSRPSFERIVDEVAGYFKIEVSSVMQSKRGRRAKNYPRKVAIYLAHCQLACKYDPGLHLKLTQPWGNT